MNLRPDKYLKFLNPVNLFPAKRTKQILSVNPTILPKRTEAQQVNITVFDYNAETIDIKSHAEISECLQYKTSGRNSWINIDGLRKSDVENVCNHFEVHPLVIEDILSINQRPKMDEAENYIFCLLNRKYNSLLHPSWLAG